MFRSVLVPLDGSPFSEKALPLAERVARGAGAPLHLVGVEDPDSGGPDMEQYLSDLVKRLEGAGIEADHVVREGKVLDAILSRARQVAADLIVMVTHGRSGLERLRLGSVTEGVVSKGTAPMLLFHPGDDDASAVPETIGRVVVALDESAHAQGILDPLVSLGKAVEISGYTIVHVAEGKGVGKAGWAPLSTIQARANQRIAPLRERLGGADVDVDVQLIVASDPSDGILGVAEDTGAGLIAMTTHGMTGVRSTLVGSVAAQVLRKWNGLLLVRRPSPE